jgi:NitT/TauT family transport system permease protein
VSSAPDRWKERVAVGAGRIGLGAGILVLWQFSPELFGINPFWFSRPSIVWEKAVATFHDGSLLRDIVTTLTETLLGFGLGSVSGILLGVLLARSRTVTAVMEPLLLIANAFPKVALAPLFLIWFGLGLAMKVAVAFSLVVVVMALATTSGIRTVRQELVDNARLMGAGDTKILSAVVFPSIAPWLFSGLKVSLAFSLIGALLGEFIAAQQGIGAMIDEGLGNFDSGAVFLGLLVLLVLSWLINSGMDFVAQKLGYAAADETYQS